MPPALHPWWVEVASLHKRSQKQCSPARAKRSQYSLQLLWVWEGNSPVKRLSEGFGEGDACGASVTASVGMACRSVRECRPRRRAHNLLSEGRTPRARTLSFVNRRDAYTSPGLPASQPLRVSRLVPRVFCVCRVRVPVETGRPVRARDANIPRRRQNIYKKVELEVRATCTCTCTCTFVLCVWCGYARRLPGLSHLCL